GGRLKPYKLLVQVDQAGQVLVAVLGGLLVLVEQILGALGEGTGQAAVTGLVGQEVLILGHVAGLGGQGERVLALGLQRRVEGEQVPVTGLDRLLHLVLAVGHAALDAVQFAGRVADDDGRAGVSLGFGNGLDRLRHVGAQRDLRDIDVTVGHADLGQALLADFLAGGRELADLADVGGLGSLSAGVGVHLGVEDHHVDVVAGRQDMIQAAVADVIRPAVAAEDPEALLGQVLLVLQDLLGLVAAAGFQRRNQRLGGLIVG